MIADELGVTKAAVYHQFNTKDEIVLGAAETELAKLDVIIVAAEEESSPKRARNVFNQASCVKILDDIPLDKACLIGCGVTTGWGSSVYAADVRPGDNVAVIGIGGIGASAVQGARLAGAEMIFAIDPVQLKRDLAPS